MRTIIHKLTLLAAALVISAVPVLADEGTINSTMEPGLQGEKNQCLLVAMNCAGQVDSFQDRIDRIQNEINKGNSVYTNEELKNLENKLENMRRDLDSLVHGS